MARLEFRFPKTILTQDPDLMRAQIQAFSRQIPLLYLILVVNSIALAWTHFGVAPTTRTLIFPVCLSTACVIRACIWWVARDRPLSDARLAGRLKTTFALTLGLAIAFLVWSLSLFPYGDAYAQSHVAFFLGITLVSCVFCLMHFRPAALGLTVIAVIPFTFFFASTGQPVFIAIAVNMLLVAIAMVYVLVNYSRDFANMIDYQQRLVRTHEAEIELAQRNAELEKAARAEILRHAARFEAAVNNIPQGLCMFDRDDRLIVCNQRYIDMYQLPEELTRRGAPWNEIIDHRVRVFGYRDLDYEDVLAQHHLDDPRLKAVTATRELGDGRVILVRQQPIAEGGWVSTHEDITERHNAERRLSHMARHDALTGLANRVFLQERLDEAVRNLKRGDAFAVLCLDLDRFKEANDALGHAVGDAVLKEVATRLKSRVMAGDTVARIGGDEFAIVQCGIAGPEEAEDLAADLLAAIKKPFSVGGQPVSIGASIGVACAPRDATAGAPLLRLADIALYRAKSDGRQAYRLFDPAMDAALQARRQLAADLRAALANEEFEVYFQPILHAATRSIRGFEALARWRHPVLGMVSPTEFIGLAEEIDLIGPLGAWVLKAACQQAANWPSEIGLAVNLSALQFKSGDLIANVRAALAGSNLSASRLEFEITETVLLEGNGENLAQLHALRHMGGRIALDDFGTGYSSLSYLRGFPFDKIKIDQSFVKNIEERDAREIVRAIANLGQTLNMTVTAEGVETEAQLAKIIVYGCDEVQGYLFSRPISGAEAAELLNARDGALLVA